MTLSILSTIVLKSRVISIKSSFFDKLLPQHTTSLFLFLLSVPLQPHLQKMPDLKGLKDWLFETSMTLSLIYTATFSFALSIGFAL